MTNLIVGAVIPLASVLIGAGMTYWLNVRVRRRSYIEDLFNEAIKAVAVADASQHYIWSVAKPKALSEEEHEKVLTEIAKAALENHTRAAGDARAALARVLQYEPGVRPYYTDPSAVIFQATEIISLLAASRDRQHQRRGRRQRPAVATPASGIVPFGVQFMVRAPRRSGVENVSTGPGWGDTDGL